MRNIDKGQKGFSVVEGLLILAVVVVLGFIGWCVYRSTNMASKAYTPVTSSQTVNANSYTGWAKVTNTVYGLTFYYPSNWSVTSYDNTPEAMPSSSAISNASQYRISKLNPTQGIENDACIDIAGGSAYNTLDFKSGSVATELGNNLEIWQNSSTANGGLATAYLITKGQQLVQLKNGDTIVAFASMACAQGYNVNLTYDQQIAYPDYQTAVKILKSIKLN